MGRFILSWKIETSASYSTLYEKLCFLVHWKDKVSDSFRNFQLNFYPSDNSVDMFEMRMKKMFLKKTTTDQIRQADLYIGNTITVSSRVLNILDSDDEVTSKNFAQEHQHTFDLIKPGSMDNMGTILTDIH